MELLSQEMVNRLKQNAIGLGAALTEAEQDCRTCQDALDPFNIEMHEREVGSLRTIAELSTVVIAMLEKSLGR